MTWRYVGGGCGLTADKAFPCDDVFEEDGTGRTVTFESTIERHGQGFPEEIDDMWLFIRTIAGLPDVRPRLQSTTPAPRLPSAGGGT